MHTFITATVAELGRQVRTRAGLVLGHQRDTSGVLAFKGIPYAAPPIGPLRWRAPQPPAPWNDVRDATTFGAGCLSALENDQRPGARSEDCLYLNVWTAAKQADEKRPVMVWIHGGGFQFGSSANPATDGGYWQPRVSLSSALTIGSAYSAFSPIPISIWKRNQATMGYRISWRRCVGSKPISPTLAAIPTTSPCSAIPPAPWPSVF